MKSIAIAYPYDRNSLAVVKHNRLLREFDLRYIMSPKGWFITGTDPCSCLGCGFSEYRIVNNFQEIHEEYSTFILLDYDSYLPFDHVIEKIEFAACQKKRIVIFKTLDKSEKEAIEQIGSIAKVEIVFFENKIGLPYKNSNTRSTLYDIKCPVMLNIGLGEYTGKFSLQLGLRNYFNDKDIKLSQIGTKKYCDAFRFNSFPYDIFQQPGVKAVRDFNAYVKNIEEKNKPDLILIGIPFGIMPISKHLPNEFGLFHYIVSQAIKPDIVMMSIYFNEYKHEFFQNIKQLCEKRFNFDIDYFVMNTVFMNWIESKRNRRYEFTTVDSGFVSRTIKNLNLSDINIISLFDVNEFDGMADNLLAKLKQYSKTSLYGL